MKVFQDGDQWCALVGDNLQEGVAGFADSADQAIASLVAQLREQIGALYYAIIERATGAALAAGQSGEAFDKWLTQDERQATRAVHGLVHSFDN